MLFDDLLDANYNCFIAKNKILDGVFYELGFDTTTEFEASVKICHKPTYYIGTYFIINKIYREKINNEQCDSAYYFEVEWNDKVERLSVDVFSFDDFTMIITHINNFFSYSKFTTYTEEQQLAIEQVNSLLYKCSELGLEFNYRNGEMKIINNDGMDYMPIPYYEHPQFDEIHANARRINMEIGII